MSRKAIVHIGPMKTGSSSIQSWLNRAREPLLEAGFLVPAAIGAPNMSRLSYLAQIHAAGEKFTKRDSERLAALREEITSQPDSVHTVIFSGEMLAHHLRRPNDLAAFKSMLDEFFDEYVILLYLRRQDELSLSRYSTALKHGYKRALPLSSALDYEKILLPWGETFGRDSIRARIFERDAMPDGDVVQDFAEALGLSAVRMGDKPLSRNSSIRPEAQVFLADLAERVRQAGFAGVFMDVAGHEAMIKRIGQEFKGRGAKPARAEALAFFEEMRESNERIRHEWFPDRETLFSEDFSGYSEEATPEPTPEQVLDVAMSVLTALMTQTEIAESSGGDGKALAPRRNIREKNEMRNRRRRHRKMRGERRKNAETEEIL